VFNSRLSSPSLALRAPALVIWYFTSDLKNRIFLFSFLKNLFIYLRERKRAGVRESVHEQEGGAKGGEEGQEDSDSPLSREQTWGSIPGS